MSSMKHISKAITSVQTRLFFICATHDLIPPSSRPGPTNISIHFLQCNNGHCVAIPGNNSSIIFSQCSDDRRDDDAVIQNEIKREGIYIYPSFVQWRRKFLIRQLVASIAQWKERKAVNEEPFWDIGRPNAILKCELSFDPHYIAACSSLPNIEFEIILDILKERKQQV